MIFQCINHYSSGSIGNYRFYIGFEDSYTYNNKRFQLEGRSHSEVRRVTDNGNARSRYKLGVTALAYLNQIYFGGSLSHGSGGFVPTIGAANYNSLSITQYYYLNMNNDANFRRFLVERLHTGHGQNDNWIVGVCAQRYYDYNVHRNQRWLIIIGRDETTSNWRGNKGAWKWSSWTFNDYANRYRIVDDSMGSFYEGNQDCFYFLYRGWYYKSNYDTKKQDTHSAKVRKMRMRYLDRIYHYYYRYDYNHYHPYNWIYEYSNWGRCNTWGGSYPNCYQMRSVAKSWTSSSFFQTANAGLFRNSWTNGGNWCVIMYEMGQSSYWQRSNNWINNYQSWNGLTHYLNSPAYTAVNNKNGELDLGNTVGAFTVQKRIYDSGTTPYTYRFNAFGGWYPDAKTEYTLQKYYGSNWSTYCTSCTQNYTSSEDIGLMWYQNANNQLEIMVNRIAYPREYKFYIGAKNPFDTAISGLI